MWIKVVALLFISQSVWAQGVYWGKKVYVGEGYARTFVQKDKAGQPTELGVALSRKALQGLGHDMKEFVMDLPEGINISPYRHITMDWNPHGHEPDDIYGLPHFDFHFYFISKAERQAISCLGDDATVCTSAISAPYLVPDYIPTPGGVPQMGWHWVDSLSPEFHGKVFTRTFIYGYYGGKPIFIEPMVTLKYLESRKTSVKTIRLPDHFPMPGFYPKSYQISYDQQHRLHKIVLKSFSKFN